MKVMTFEDTDVRRAIRVELGNRNGDKVGPLLASYSNGRGLLEGLLTRIREDPERERYSERRCFYPKNEKLSGRLSALLLEIFREELGNMDVDYKGTLLAALLSRGVVPIPLLEALDALRESREGSLSDGFRIMEVTPDGGIRVSLSLFGESEGKVEVSGRIEEEILTILSPERVIAQPLEWTLISFARMAGLEGIEYKAEPVNMALIEGGEPASCSYLQTGDNRFFRVERAEEGRVRVVNIRAIESEGSLLLDPHLALTPEEIRFGDLTIAARGSAMHEIPLERLLTVVGDEHS